jgi:hypothetical protein
MVVTSKKTFPFTTSYPNDCSYETNPQICEHGLSDHMQFSSKCQKALDAWLQVELINGMPVCSLLSQTTWS